MDCYRIQRRGARQQISMITIGFITSTTLDLVRPSLIVKHKKLHQVQNRAKIKLTPKRIASNIKIRPK